MNKFYIQVFIQSIFLLCNENLIAQNIGSFNSVTPTAQTQNLILPNSHTFQRIIKSGDALSFGGTLGANTDFTGYVPVSGSSKNGYLSISNETTPAGCAILGISYNNTTHTWTVNNGGNVDFLTNATFGNTSRFCSGTVTPNNTIIVCEEDITNGDANSDGYEDRGWLIEIDPATRTVINQDGMGFPDRLWAIGRGKHENAAVKADNTVLYTGVDDAANGYLYKFVPFVPGNFSSGTLYVLQTTVSLGTGTWQIVANSTIPQRNATPALSTAAGAYNFNGIEDVEIGPDGKIYFAAKAEGKVYCFTDNGTTIAGLEVFVGNSAYPTVISYDIDGAGPLPPEPWGRGNDNLAFDGEGNLWVCQDAIVASDRNHIWVVGPTHTQASPQVRVFATTPVRCEPTGITFTPDYRFMFLSFMSPNGANTFAQNDAAGASVVFNTHTTVVVARIENLGPLATLALTFSDFSVLEENKTAKLAWSVANVTNHSHFDIERSGNGISFEKIYTESKIIANGGSMSFTFNDKDLQLNAVTYYRIKQVDINGSFHYSDIKSIRINKKNDGIVIYPVPAGDDLNIDYTSENVNTIRLTVLDAKGQAVLTQNKNVSKGYNLLQFDTKKLSSGNYTLVIVDGDKQYSGQQFIKL